jgi:AbrB family looped-hinge helix DNA binding protein
MVRSVVAVNAQGRITLPAEARRRLGLDDGARLEVSVEDHEIRLRPAQLVVAEDAWAYTAQSLQSIKRSLEDIKAGRVYSMSTDEIARSAQKRPVARKR